MTDEILQEFLLESRENLDQLDRELVGLEEDPRNNQRLASVFRTVHTIKGTAGFFQFAKLESVAHAGESLLSKLRDGAIPLERTRTSILLAMVDVIRGLLAQIESQGREGTGHYGGLIEAMSLACSEQTLLEAGEVLAELGRPPPAKPAVELAKPKATSVPPAAPVVEVPALKPFHVEPASEPRHDERPSADARIRVDVRLLDKLMNLVGELVLARNQLLQQASVSADASLVSSCQRLNLITTELQEGVMKTRLQPIENVWSRFPRVVRDLSQSCGKQVKLEMEGKTTELDKTIIEAISDPLTHLVRNSVDHGIELPHVRSSRGKPAMGTVKLRAYHEGGRVNIEIADDGAGIDPERIKAKAVERGLISVERARSLAVHETLGMIFLPGFSTAEAVTNISGRGVGMDVVKSNIERLGGSVDVESQLGVGTVIRIRIPLTLAIIPALIVGTGNARFAIPQVNLVELVRLEAEQAKNTIERLHGVPLFRLRGSLLALVELSGVLEMNDPRPPRDVNIVVLQADERQFGLLVDAIYDTEEIVVKPLGRELKGLDVYAGATIMGDGEVALILDVSGLAERSGVTAEPRRNEHEPSVAAREGAARRYEKLLLFRSGGNSRMAIPLDAVARLEEFSRELVERVGRDEVIQYRGDILPLLHVCDVFGESRSEGPTLRVVVHSSPTGNVGLVVDAIEDVVETELCGAMRSGRAGTLGVAAIHGHVTELVDANALLQLSGVA